MSLTFCVKEAQNATPQIVVSKVLSRPVADQAAVFDGHPKTMHLMCLFTHVTDRYRRNRQPVGVFNAWLRLRSGSDNKTPRLSGTAAQVRPVLSQQTVGRRAN